MKRIMMYFLLILGLIALPFNTVLYADRRSDQEFDDQMIRYHAAIDANIPFSDDIQNIQNIVNKNLNYLTYHLNDYAAKSLPLFDKDLLRQILYLAVKVIKANPAQSKNILCNIAGATGVTLTDQNSIPEFETVRLFLATLNYCLDDTVPAHLRLERLNNDTHFKAQLAPNKICERNFPIESRLDALTGYLTYIAPLISNG